MQKLANISFFENLGSNDHRDFVSFFNETTEISTIFNDFNLDQFRVQAPSKPATTTAAKKTTTSTKQKPLDVVKPTKPAKANAETDPNIATAVKYQQSRCKRALKKIGRLLAYTAVVAALFGGAASVKELVKVRQDLEDTKAKLEIAETKLNGFQEGTSVIKANEQQVAYQLADINSTVTEGENAISIGEDNINAAIQRNKEALDDNARQRESIDKQRESLEKQRESLEKTQEANQSSGQAFSKLKDGTQNLTEINKENLETTDDMKNFRF